MASEPADHRGDLGVWFGEPAPQCELEEINPAQGESLYRLIGSRWVVDVLRQLRGDAVRYNVLHRRLQGISHKVLAQTLRRLQRAGVVSRRAHRAAPRSVEYALTASGLELMRYLELLERWAGAQGLLSS
ncbi:MAG TPA: helix-turn-helix domain-containing protein [Candidatus Dormibacteraeota bacterium]|jgi:DNA-binding HxlR family transcriptional regulator